MYEVLIEFNEYKVSDTVALKENVAKRLIAEGYIKPQTKDIKAEEVKTKERKFKK